MSLHVEAALHDTQEAVDWQLLHDLLHKDSQYTCAPLSPVCRTASAKAPSPLGSIACSVC